MHATLAGYHEKVWSHEVWKCIDVGLGGGGGGGGLGVGGEPHVLVKLWKRT